MKGVPYRLAKLINGYSWEQITIGCSEAMIFLLKGNSYNHYLKIQPNHSVESLRQEKDRLEWLEGKLPVPEVLYYEQDEVNEFLLISEVKGMNASENNYQSDLPLLMKLLATGLKAIHSVNIEDCLFNQTLDIKIEEARHRVDKGLVDKEDFDEVRQGMKAAEIFDELTSKKPKREELVFTHGDYCLPNIIIDKRSVSGFIDWGRAGISDRYQDLALAIRSITGNFGKEWIPLFLEEYGIKDLDESKVFYYQLLDEFF
jgi:aminoglycoside phosphotransferase